MGRAETRMLADGLEAAMEEIASLRSRLAEAEARAEAAERREAKLVAWATVDGRSVQPCVFIEGVRYRAAGDMGFVYGDTPEAAIRKAAGLEPTP